MMTRRRWICPYLLTLALSLLIAQSASAQTPLSYSGMLPDADGIQRSIDFTGQFNGNTVSGTVTVEGNKLGVAGTLAADGSFAGSVTLPNGESLGTFQGHAAPDQTLAIGYALGGRAGSVNVPVSASLPASLNAQSTSR